MYSFKLLLVILILKEAKYYTVCIFDNFKLNFKCKRQKKIRSKMKL